MKRWPHTIFHLRNTRSPSPRSAPAGRHSEVQSNGGPPSRSGPAVAVPRGSSPAGRSNPRKEDSAWMEERPVSPQPSLRRWRACLAAILIEGENRRDTNLGLAARRVWISQVFPVRPQRRLRRRWPNSPSVARWPSRFHGWLSTARSQLPRVAYCFSTESSIVHRQPHVFSDSSIGWRWMNRGKRR